MERGKRRSRTEAVATRRTELWQTFNGEPPSKKRAGAFRTQSALGCGCSDHRGMCHATTKNHEPLRERRNKARLVKAAVEESDGEE